MQYELVSGFQHVLPWNEVASGLCGIGDVVSKFVLNSEFDLAVDIGEVQFDAKALNGDFDICGDRGRAGNCRLCGHGESNCTVLTTELGGCAVCR